MTAFKQIFKILVFTCLLLSFGRVNAQVKTPQQKLDSILSVNNAHPKEDSVKLLIYKSLYRQYIRMKNKEKINEYIEKSIVLAKKLNIKSLEGEAYQRRALGYHGVANYQKAEENYFLAIDAFTLAKDDDMVAGMYLNLGALYQGIPDYAKALAVSQKAIAIYQKNGNDIDLASVYVNISGIYKDLGQQANALTYLSKALTIFIRDGGNINRGVAVAYNAIGSTYYDASDEELAKMGLKPSQKYDLVLDNLNKGLKVAIVLDDASVLGPLYRDLGLLYEKTGKRTQALESYLKAVKYAMEVDNKTDYGNALITLASFYLGDQAYDKAYPLLTEALKIGENDKTLDIQKSAYQLLSTLEEQRGNYNASLAYYKKFIAIRYQIFNEEKEKEITRKQLQIDFAIKEKDYQLKQQVTDGELQRQFLLAKQQQQQLVLRQQELALSDKEKSLQRLTFLKKQADLENEKRFQANVLHQEQIKATLDKQIQDKQLVLQKSRLRFNEKVNIFLGILVTILFAGGVFVVYSQRKTAKLNKLVSEQKQELEKLSKVKDRIFSVVSHDMRTPVNSLISFIQLLEGGNISQEKLNKYAANLKNTLGYTSTMMENLLNWASSQMQGFKPIIEKFDMKFCVQEVINSMDAIASQKNIKIINQIVPETYGAADQNMTALVLRNLVSNAIKFTPNGGLITLNSKILANQVTVTIIDTGIGLSVQQVENFNQEGYQETGKSTKGTNQEKGTGIGLALCKSFVAMMNGVLQVNSKVGAGSEFTLLLPKATS